MTVFFIADQKSCKSPSEKNVITWWRFKITKNTI